jgi:prephenate dehydratase
MGTINSIGFLGPAGTYAEAAAAQFGSQWDSASLQFVPYPTIAATLHALARGDLQWAVAPVENSVEGGVDMTLDTLWQLQGLQIQQALVLPIRHTLITCATDPGQVEVVYSHPQALGQCQNWLLQHLPHATQIQTSSTTEALSQVKDQATVAVISSERAAHLYTLPILACPINDHPDNCTRFWLISHAPSPGGSITSLAFSLPANVPGALLKPLQIFAQRQLNMSRIESRPTKQSAGTYFFWIDLEHPEQDHLLPEVIEELTGIAEILKVYGSYPLQSFVPAV